jgi:hypothetical protein
MVGGFETWVSVLSGSFGLHPHPVDFLAEKQISENRSFLARFLY